jgi:hypothetical protein
MHLMLTAGAGLLIVGKVIFDTLARQALRQGSAAAFLAFWSFHRRQASIRQVGEIAVVVTSVLVNGNLLGFIEEAIDVLFASRHKAMQPRQLFLKFDDALRKRLPLSLECGDFGSMRRQPTAPSTLQHQVRRFGSSDS